MTVRNITRTMAILLSLALAFCMTACGENIGETNNGPKTITSIEIGGDFEPFDLSGVAFGVYTKIDMPEWFKMYEHSTGEMYYCEDSNKPYLAVLTRPIEAGTFEDEVENACNIWGYGYYQMLGDNLAYMTALRKKLKDGTSYFSECYMYDLGDSMKFIVFFSKTEEVQLADSDLYFNIMAGSESKLSKEDELFEASVYAVYADSYLFPNVYASKVPKNYKEEKTYFSFLKKFKVTKKQYRKWAKNWSEQDVTQYLNALGYEVAYKTTFKNDDFNAYLYSCKTDNSTNANNEIFTFVERNGKWYLLDTWTSQIKPTPAYSKAIINSMHVK